MSRFCPKCGTGVSQTARFCNRCGRLRQKEVPPPSPADLERMEPTRPRLDLRRPEPLSLRDPVGSRLPPRASAEPPPPSEVPSPPPYWESYDYPSPSESSTTPAWQGLDAGPPRDASRPLPPLSQVLPPDMESTRERAREIVLNFSLWAAGIVLFPVPFSDLVLLMPVQSAMVISIGRAYGLKDPPEKVLAILAGACGASVFGQITVLFVANFIPILGKFISAPFVFGWTYGLGEVAMRYFESQGEASPDELRTIFEKASKEASRNYGSGPRIQPNQALDNIREYVSEDEYRKIRERFGSN